MSGRDGLPTVLVTGAAGALGSVLMAELPQHGWRVRGLSRSRPAAGADHDVVVASVTDLDAMIAACAGVDAIVHLGGVSTPGHAWADYLDTNINGTWTVLEAARLSRVPRVVLASSNHAVGYARRSAEHTPADIPGRPDSLYGVSKVAMEGLGSFYADEHGLRTVSLRIGSCFPRPTSWRMLSTWLSPADFVRLTLSALSGSWSGHPIVWGISRNTRRWLSLAEGERIGYFPEDDAEVYADEFEPSANDFIGGSPPPHPTE